MEWTVVTVIAALVGLFLTVGKPVVELNKSITKLTTMLDMMGKRLDALEIEAHSTHGKLWAKINEHDKRLALMEHFKPPDK